MPRFRQVPFFVKPPPELCNNVNDDSSASKDCFAQPPLVDISAERQLRSSNLQKPKRATPADAAEWDAEFCRRRKLACLSINPHNIRLASGGGGGAKNDALPSQLRPPGTAKKVATFATAMRKSVKNVHDGGRPGLFNSSKGQTERLVDPFGTGLRAVAAQMQADNCHDLNDFRLHPTAGCSAAITFRDCSVTKHGAVRTDRSAQSARLVGLKFGLQHVPTGTYWLITGNAPEHMSGRGLHKGWCQAITLEAAAGGQAMDGGGGHAEEVLEGAVKDAGEEGGDDEEEEEEEEIDVRGESGSHNKRLRVV